LIGHMNT